MTVITSAPNFPHGKLYPGYGNRWRQVEVLNGIQVVRVKTFMAKNEGFLLRIIDFVSFMVTGFFAGLFQERPDLVVASSPTFFAAVAGWAVAKCRGLPFVFELVDLWPASIVATGSMKRSAVIRMIEKVELFLYRQSSLVIAITHAFKVDLAERGIDGDKVLVVVNGADLSKFKPVPRSAEMEHQIGLEGKFVIGYIGTMGMSHALENVMNTAALLKGHPAISFLLVGPGAMRDKLLAMKEQMGLDNVLLIPQQPKEKIIEYWSVVDVALVHLKNDPVFTTVLPSKIFEAMAMGKPLILAAPFGEAAELVQKHNAGMWVQPEDAEALASAVFALHASREQMKTYAERSLNTSNLYSRERQAQNFLWGLEEVHQGRGASAGKRRF